MDPRRWIVQPLVEAGLHDEEIADLLFRLSVEVRAGSDDVDERVRIMASGQPPAARAAWVETLSRLIAAGGLVT